MKQKKGQFFLIAAVIIITVVVSIVTISNYIKTEEAIKLYDLGEELGIESQQVLDYGTYNELDDTEMKELMETFITNYISYIEEEKNIYFIFGNKGKINVVGYQDLNNESVCVKLNPVTPICGDNVVNQRAEECDDGCISATKTYTGCGVTDNGDGCSSFCKLEAPLMCNNDLAVDNEEFCDGTELNDQSCATLGFAEPAGLPVGNTALKCDDCKFDTSDCININEAEECTPLEIGITQEFIAEEISKVAITIGGFTYEFKLNPGENFYFVIWQTIGEEQHIVTSND